MKTLEEQYNDLAKANEDLRKEKAELLNKANELENKLRTLVSRHKTTLSFQIAQLRSMQINMSVIKTGTTHRQKELFCDMVSKALDIEICKIIESVQHLKYEYNGSEELPF